MMPGMDGLEVARRIRQNPRLARLRILLLTSANLGGLREYSEYGVDAFLRKPVVQSDLLNSHLRAGGEDRFSVRAVGGRPFLDRAGLPPHPRR